MNKIEIDIVSDVVCPWCVIGYKRLEKVLEGYKDLKYKISWHPFELNPNMPIGGMNLRTHLAEKYGTTLEGSIQARINLTEMGLELGFQFNYFDEMKMFNTFNAHKLLHYAKQQNKQTELKLRLFSAYFGEQKEIDLPQVLISEAVKVGLDQAESMDVLISKDYSLVVRQEAQNWLRKGVSGVPLFLFNGTKHLTGAQSVDSFAKVIDSLIE